MQRKLIQLSPSTAVVSLPSKWLRENNIQKGDNLTLEVNENNIVVTTTKHQPKETHIDISTYNLKLSWIAMDMAYTAGYDSIIIKTKDAKQTAEIAKTIKYFLGMIIIDERKTYIHFKSIEEAPIELEKIVTRIFNLILALIEDATESIKNKNWQELARIKHRDYLVNSYTSYASRSVNKFGYRPFSKIGTIHSFLKIIEMLSDKLCIIFEHIAASKITYEKLTVIDACVDFIRQTRQIHFKYANEKICKLEKQQSQLAAKHNIPSELRPHIQDLEELFFAILEIEMQLHA